MTALSIALDVGPLHGHRTGVGTATAGMIQAFRARDDIELVPYLTSFRAAVAPGERRLPLPGIVASHLWSRTDHPRADRWIGPADVVHGTNYVAPPTSMPTVISVYDCWFLRRPELASPVVRRAGRVLRRAVAVGAWVHATSNATADEVRELLGTERVATVFLGAPVASSTHEAGEPGDVGGVPAIASELTGRRFLVSVATEERRKSLPLLVHAFEHLADDHHDLLLVLAGARGDDSEAIGRVIDDVAAPTRNRIRRLGAVDDPTKEWLVHHAAALAYPSLDEGFGFPVLEAQASGTPVVASRVGSIPEIAGDAALLVDDRQPMSFATALDEVLANGSCRLGLIESGYRNVRRFSWSTTADQLVDLYRTAIEAAT